MDCYINLKGGITPIADLTSVPATDNGSGIVRCTKTAHGLPDGAVVNNTGSYYTGIYIITKISDDVFDLNDCVYTTNRTITKIQHIGGNSWANATNTIKIANAPNQVGEFNVKVAKTPVINLGIKATFTNLSNTVVLDTPLTKVVDDCIGNTWTAVAGVTAGTSSVRHLGATSQAFTLANRATFSIPGKVAYKTFASEQNFSAYTKLSCWFGSNSPYYGIQLGSCFKICLCSDSTGDVIVNELPIFDVQGSNNLNSMVLDYGGALGSNINSVAIYATAECRSTTSTIQIFLNNLIACNQLHHETIVGKNNGNGFWSPIKYIDGATLAIMASNTSGPTAGLGYEHDTTENVDLYGIEAVSIPLIGSTTTSAYEFRVSTSGAVNDSKLIFGVDTTSGEADGYTYLRPKSNYGYLCHNQGIRFYNIILSNFSKLDVSNVETKYYNTIAFSMPQIMPDTIAFNTFSQRIDFTDCLFYNFLINDANYTVMQIYGVDATFKNCYFGKITKITIQAIGVKFIDTVFDYVTSYIANIVAGDVKFIRTEFRNALSSYFPINTIRGGTFYMDDCIIEKTPITSNIDFIRGSASGYIKGLNGDQSANFVMKDPLLIAWQTSEKPTGAPGAWSVRSYRSTDNYPDDFVDFKVAEVAVEDGVAYTFRLWVKTALFTSKGFFVIKCNGTEYEIELDGTANWKEYYALIVPESTQVAEVAVRLSNITNYDELFFASLSISS